ncbi:DUF6318 family protein [Demequina soli]|uniref:DUF6318 family protein n=1 Tax=Demequina soli TaxID=1638987 RepID=UPI000783DEA7|nr:DUF6318 family protein [Demequina soli]
MRFIPGGRVARRAVAAAMAAGAVVLAAGCTGEPGPIVTDVPTVSATPVASVSASPSPVASVSQVAMEPLTNEELFALMPEGANRSDLVGAMVTARFFLEQYAVMFQTGDTRAWNALSGDSCGYCADALVNQGRVQDQGFVAQGGEIKVREPTIRAHLTGHGAVYQATADVAAALLVDASGAESVAEVAGPAVFALELQRVGEAWRVTGVAVNEES